MAHPASSTARQATKGNAAVITSRENRWLKRFRAALSGERGDDGIVGVEGVRLVEAALGSGLPVEALLVSESGARHLPRVAPVLASSCAGASNIRQIVRRRCGYADAARDRRFSPAATGDDRKPLARHGAACRAGGRAGSRQCGDDCPGGGSVRSNRGGDLSGGRRWDSRSVRAKGAARVGGIGTATADRPWHFADRAARAIANDSGESLRCCRSCCRVREKFQKQKFGSCFPFIAPVGHRLENSRGHPDRQRRFRLASGNCACSRRARLYSASGGKRSCGD